jgi:hypothetical protein
MRYLRIKVVEGDHRRRQCQQAQVGAHTQRQDTHKQRQTNMRYLRIQVVLEGATSNAGGHRWRLIRKRLVRTCGMGSGLFFI